MLTVLVWCCILSLALLLAFTSSADITNRGRGFHFPGPADDEKSDWESSPRRDEDERESKPNHDKSSDENVHGHKHQTFFGSGDSSSSHEHSEKASSGFFSKPGWPIDPADFWFTSINTVYGPAHLVVGGAFKIKIRDENGKVVSTGGVMVGAAILSVGGAITKNDGNTVLQLRLHVRDYKLLSINTGVAIELDKERPGKDSYLFTLDPKKVMEKFNELTALENYPQYLHEFTENPQRFFEKHIEIFYPYGINLQLNLRASIGKFGEGIIGLIKGNTLWNKDPVWIIGLDGLEFPPNNMFFSPNDTIQWVDKDGNVKFTMEPYNQGMGHGDYDYYEKYICRPVVAGALGFDTVRHLARKFVLGTRDPDEKNDKSWIKYNHDYENHSFERNQKNSHPKSKKGNGSDNHTDVSSEGKSKKKHKKSKGDSEESGEGKQKKKVNKHKSDDSDESRESKKKRKHSKKGKDTDSSSSSEDGENKNKRKHTTKSSSESKSSKKKHHSKSESSSQNDESSSHQSSSKRSKSSKKASSQTEENSEQTGSGSSSGSGSGANQFGFSYGK